MGNLVSGAAMKRRIPTTLLVLVAGMASQAAAQTVQEVRVQWRAYIGTPPETEPGKGLTSDARAVDTPFGDQVDCRRTRRGNRQRLLPERVRLGIGPTHHPGCRQRPDIDGPQRSGRNAVSDAVVAGRHCRQRLCFGHHRSTECPAQRVPMESRHRSVRTASHPDEYR